MWLFYLLTTNIINRIAYRYDVLVYVNNNLKQNLIKTITGKKILWLKFKVWMNLYFGNYNHNRSTEKLIFDFVNPLFSPSEETSIFYCRYFATQIISGAKELVVSV